MTKRIGMAWLDVEEDKIASDSLFFVEEQEFFDFWVHELNEIVKRPLGPDDPMKWGALVFVERQEVED